MIELKMPRRLESPNTWNGRHWRVKHRISQEWEAAIGWAVIEWTMRRTGQTLGLMDAVECLGGIKAAGYVVDSPVRVEVERHVPSSRNFIRDDDNLRFAVKPLLDALKRQGYIKNDSRKWLDHPTPTQHISADGKDYTIVKITAAV